MTSSSKPFSPNKTYQGELITEACNRETGSGKRVWWFALKTKKELLDMQAWENSCDGNFSRLCLGAVITATGYFKPVNIQDANTKTFMGKEGNELFIIKAFYFEDEGKKPLSRKELIVKEYGSISKWKDDTRAHVKRHCKRTGEVAVIQSDGTIGFRSKEYAVKVGSSHVEAIEFVMDTLGAQVVTKELMELTQGNISFMTSKEGAHKYKEWLSNAVLRSKTLLETGKISTAVSVKSRSLEQRVLDLNLGEDN